MSSGSRRKKDRLAMTLLLVDGVGIAERIRCPILQGLNLSLKLGSSTANNLHAAGLGISDIGGARCA